MFISVPVSNPWHEGQQGNKFQFDLAWAFTIDIYIFINMFIYIYSTCEPLGLKLLCVVLCWLLFVRFFEGLTVSLEQPIWLFHGVCFGKGAARKWFSDRIQIFWLKQLHTLTSLTSSGALFLWNLNNSTGIDQLWLSNIAPEARGPWNMSFLFESHHTIWSEG